MVTTCYKCHTVFEIRWTAGNVFFCPKCHQRYFGHGAGDDLRVEITEHNVSANNFRPQEIRFWNRLRRVMLVLKKIQDDMMYTADMTYTSKPWYCTFRAKVECENAMLAIFAAARERDEDAS